jgi:hypothetical protein
MPSFVNTYTELVATDSKTLNANNTTANVAIFGITGTVLVRSLWGIVTTVLSSSITVAYWRLNDQTAQIALTASSGTTLSSVAAGSLIIKTGLVAAALTLKSNAAGAVLEPTTLETTVESPIILVKKTGATTNIEFTYTTTNTPASGAIQFFLRYVPLSADGAVTPQ